MLAGSLCVTMRIGQDFQNEVSVCKYLSFLNLLPENLITESLVICIVPYIYNDQIRSQGVKERKNIVQ